MPSTTKSSDSKCFEPTLNRSVDDNLNFSNANPVVAALTAAVLLLCSRLANADVGAGALTVVCDPGKDVAELRFHILWNEELEAFRTAHPKGRSIAGSSRTVLLESLHGVFQRSCKTRSRLVVFTWRYDQEITAKQDGVTIAKKEISSQYATMDFEYRIRSLTARTWEECKNDNYGSFNGKVRCGPVTPSTSTVPTEFEVSRSKP